MKLSMMIMSTLRRRGRTPFYPSRPQAEGGRCTLGPLLRTTSLPNRLLGRTPIRSPALANAPQTHPTCNADTQKGPKPPPHSRAAAKEIDRCRRESALMDAGSTFARNAADRKSARMGGRRNNARSAAGHKFARIGGERENARNAAGLKSARMGG